MNTKRKSPPINAEFKQAVVNYLALRVISETLREKVDAIYTEILKEIPIYEDMNSRLNGDRITEYKNMYLSADDAAFKKIVIEADRRTRELGIKPSDMQRDFCPALVAEDKCRKAAYSVVEFCCVHIGKPAAFAEDVLASSLENYKKFLELAVKMVLAADKK